MDRQGTTPRCSGHLPSRRSHDLATKARITQSPTSTRRFARHWRWLLTASLVTVLTLSGYAGYTIRHANFHVVATGEAYRSGQMTPEQLAHAIDQYEIKSVLNLRGGHPATVWYQEELETTASHGATHFDRSLSSGRELTDEELDDLVALLQRAPKPILIHCQGGADRSGLAAALFELAIAGRRPDQADRELSIWYGHVPWIRPKVLAMDRSFRHYVNDHRLVRS